MGPCSARPSLLPRRPAALMRLPMPLYRLGDLDAATSDGAWAAPSADLIGDVRLGARPASGLAPSSAPTTRRSSSATTATSRTARSATRDAGFPLMIGARVTIGHQAILHGCTVADDCLIGMGARILNGAVIERSVSSAQARCHRRQDISRGQPDRRLAGPHGPAAHRRGEASASRLSRALCRKSRSLHGRAQDAVSGLQ